MGWSLWRHGRIHADCEAIHNGGQPLYIHRPGGHPAGPGKCRPAGPQLCGQRTPPAGTGQPGVQHGLPPPPGGGGGQPDPPGGHRPAGGHRGPQPHPAPGADPPVLPGDPAGGGGEPPAPPDLRQCRAPVAGAAAGAQLLGGAAAGRLPGGQQRPLPGGVRLPGRGGESSPVHPPGAGAGLRGHPAAGPVRPGLDAHGR